ncbi:MAG: YajQ family cyclic di-GMP-binding protein [Bdellovibrionales bacterium]|nr:YajQ family cyclic di-GMP-binding protein [Bdellovibrionales bacterium]
MPSFDIVSKIDLAEVDNAVVQAQKEVAQRYDFKDSQTTIERKEQVIHLNSTDEMKVQATLDVLQSKLIKRGISLKSLDPKNIIPAAGGRAKQELFLKSGIDKTQSKEIIKLIKDSKMKVQSSIQGDAVRVSGKKRDDLQEAIALIKTKELPIHIEFENFRD